MKGSGCNAQDPSDKLFRGLQWGFTCPQGDKVMKHTNTCNIDCLITGLFIVTEGRVMLEPLVKFCDPNSLPLSQTMALLREQGAGSGGDLSR